MITHLKGLLFVLFLIPFMALGASPDITMKTLDGKPRNVNEFIGKGKWTVVSIWHSECPICNSEIHQMEFFHNDHKNKDAIVLGVSVDGVARLKDAKRFVDEHTLSFTNLVAEAEQIALFGAGSFIGTPTTYVYSPQGELAAKQIGPVTQADIENFLADTKKSTPKKG